jgi:hypothetical protein
VLLQAVVVWLREPGSRVEAERITADMPEVADCPDRGALRLVPVAQAAVAAVLVLRVLY